MENNNMNNQKEKLDLYTCWERLLQNIEIVFNQLFSLATVIGLVIGTVGGYICVRLAYIHIPLDIDAIIEDINYSINKFVAVDITQILVVVFYIFLILFLAIPHKSKRMTTIFKDLKITDKKSDKGNTSIYVKTRKYKRKSKVKVMTLISNGVLPEDFKENNNLKRISRKDKKHVIDVVPHEKNESRLLLYYIKRLKYKIIHWLDEYLQKDDFVLALGLNDMGELEFADLNNSAHLGIFGSTGSGKSVQLANLCCQSLLKGAKLIIAEFSKRGIDWAYWKNLKNCEVFTQLNLFLEFLNSYIVKEVERRANLLEKYNCKKISDYNKLIDKGEIIDEKLERIIIALDEAGQVFIPSLDKEREELLKPIRTAINKLITEYRFCGIHLFIATQIPSHKILTEEIRHLTDLKMCGISTAILSEMAIGNEEASQIDIRHKGRFITNTGKSFQGFFFNEEEVFKNYPKKEVE